MVCLLDKLMENASIPPAVRVSVGVPDNSEEGMCFGFNLGHMHPTAWALPLPSSPLWWTPSVRVSQTWQHLNF